MGLMVRFAGSTVTRFPYEYNYAHYPVVASLHAMRLNGWQRLGIVASVVWILGAGFYTANAVSDREAQTAADSTVACEDAHRDVLNPECNERGIDYLNATKNDARIEAALVAFVPVLLGWGFAYLALFVARWVRRGFAGAA